MATGIYDAAVYGNRAEVERIIGKHPEAVNEADEYGYTPLHGLAEEEHLEIAQYLIDRGARINAATVDGITPLHLAASPEMASLFLRNGADLEARSREGDTPLLILAGEPDREPAIEVLLEAGANVNATGRDGETALDVALARDEEEKAALLQQYGGKTARSL